MNKSTLLCGDSSRMTNNADPDQITPGSKVIKRFSCSTQLSMNFVLVINLKFLTNANSFLLNKAEHDIFSANNYENANF